MKQRRLASKITAIVLSMALVQVPYGLGYQNPSDAEQRRMETCRRLLESIGNSKEVPAFTTRLKETFETQRITDLTNSDFNAFNLAASQAKPDDVLVVNERRLAEEQFTTALANSPALFTVAAAAGLEGVKTILHSPAGQPEILVAIPTDAIGVEKVFGVPASDSAPTVKYLGDTSGQFRALKNSHLLNYPLNGRSLVDHLVSKAKRDTSDPLVVVAHSERGILKLPDGSSIRVDELYQALGKRVGVVLSCDTINSEQTPTNVLLTNRELDFRDVASALSSAEHLLSANPNLSLGSLLFAFSKGIPTGESSSRKTVMVVAMVVGGLVFVGLLYYWICEDSTTAPPFCPQDHKSDPEPKNEGKVQ